MREFAARATHNGTLWRQSLDDAESGRRPSAVRRLDRRNGRLGCRDQGPDRRRLQIGGDGGRAGFRKTVRPSRDRRQRHRRRARAAHCRRRGVRRRHPHPASDRPARPERQGGERIAGTPGAGRDRRRRQERRARSRHPHRRRVQDGVAAGTLGRLYRPGGRRVERHLSRAALRDDGHRGCDQGKGRSVPGGLVAERVATGEAELGIHQISEILAVPGATLVGALPADLQNYTVYAGGVSTASRDSAAAQAFLAVLHSSRALAVLQEKGMEAP